MNKIGKLLTINILICIVISILLSANTLNVKADYCAPYSTKQCISNIVYWYNSCGVLQDIYQNCNTTNQICQNGQCINKTPSLSPTPLQSSAPTPIPTPVLNPAPTGIPNQNQNTNLIISIFGQKESNTLQWEKNISAANNDKINFLLIVKNISNLPVDNIFIKTDITDSLAYTGNLKIDNLSSDGNIVSGISLGTIPPKISKVISFTGSVSPQTNKNNVQVIANINVGDIIYDSDYMIVNIDAQTAPNIATAAIGNSIIGNLKKNWYIWIVIAIVLILVFIIIFRKLSSNI